MNHGIDFKLLELVDRYAEEENRSRTNAINIILKDHLYQRYGITDTNVETSDDGNSIR